MSVVRKGVEYVLALKGDLAKRAADTDRELGQLEGTAGSTKVAFAALAAAGLAAGVAIADMTDDVVGAIDEMTTLASATGLSTETIEGLSIIAQMTRKDLSDLVPRNFAKNMEDARNGTGKAVDGFRTLGLQQEDLRGRFADNNVLLLETIKRLNAVEDPALRAATASEIFGKQGEQMLSAFADVDDLEAAIKFARMWGIDTGPEAAEAAGKVQRATASMNIAIDTAKQSVFDLVAAGEEWITVLSAVGVGMAEYTERTYRAVLVMDGLGNSVDPLSAAVDAGWAYYESVTALTDQLETAQDTTKEWADELTEADDVVKTTNEDLEEMYKALGLIDDEAEGAKTSVKGLREELAKPWDLDMKEFRKLEEANSRDARELETKREQDALNRGAQALLDRQTTGVDTPAEDAPVHAMIDAPSVAMMGDALMSAMVPFLAPVAALEQVPFLLTDLTATVETLPDTLLSIPELTVGLLDAITMLPSELVAMAPELALAIGDVVFTSFTVGAEMFFDVVADALYALPGEFASELASVLDDLFGGLNPFDGDGSFFGLDAVAGVEDLLGVDLPFLDKGGTLTSDGLYYGHAGERVLNPTETQNYSYNNSRSVGDIHVHGADPYRSIDLLSRHLGPFGSGMGILPTGVGV